MDYYNASLPMICEQSSVREVKAVECEREVVKVKCAEYMEDHIGEEYDGYISGILKRGFFVQTTNLVEGLVSVDTLKGDYFIFDEERQVLIGESTKHTFSLGEKVKVKCVSANKALGEVDFELVNFSLKKDIKEKKEKKSKYTPKKKKR
jgi:ribonuclease R